MRPRLIPRIFDRRYAPVGYVLYGAALLSEVLALIAGFRTGDWPVAFELALPLPGIALIIEFMLSTFD